MVRCCTNTELNSAPPNDSSDQKPYTSPKKPGAYAERSRNADAAITQMSRNTSWYMMTLHV